MPRNAECASGQMMSNCIDHVWSAVFQVQLIARLHARLAIPAMRDGTRQNLRLPRSSSVARPKITQLFNFFDSFCWPIGMDRFNTVVPC